MKPQLNKKQNRGRGLGLLAGGLFLLGPVLILADMAINNDFAAYDAAMEGPLCALGFVILVAAPLVALAAVWLGVSGNRSGTHKSYLGPAISFGILGILGLWLLQVLAWIL